MRIELIKKPTEFDWLLVKNCALNTVGKWSNKPPTDEWRAKILASEHSPIRELQYVFLIKDLPSWVATHIVRHHVGVNCYVTSQRNDRQEKYDRDLAPQNAPVDMVLSVNAQSLINISHKRLCMQASLETRQVFMEIKNILTTEEPLLAELLVPLCEYRNFKCTEMFPCPKANNFRKI